MIFPLFFSSPPSKSSYESNHSLRRPPAYPLSPGVKRQKVSLACFLHTCYFFRSSPVPWSKSTEGSCTVRVPPQECQRGLFFVLFLILNVNVQVSLGKNSVVTVVEGSPTAEWWRVETDQGVQVSVVRIKINIIEIIDAI